jgi:hypothetical protein
MTVGLAYVTIGLISALVLVAIDAYTDDEGERDADQYGAYGVMTVVCWPIVVPFAVFSAIGWYFSEKVSD